MKLVIEPITIDDIDIIYKLDKKYLKEHWTKESLTNEITKPAALYLKAKIKNNIIGFIGANYCLDESEINKLIIDNKYRRKNIATILLNELSQRLKSNNVNLIFLEVRVTNYQAISFYEKNKFIKINVRKMYYKDNNENAIVMLKKI